MDCKTCLFFQEAAKGQKVEELIEVIKFQKIKNNEYMTITKDNLNEILKGAGLHPATKKRVLDFFNKTVSQQDLE